MLLGGGGGWARGAWRLLAPLHPPGLPACQPPACMPPRCPCWASHATPAHPLHPLTSDRALSRPLCPAALQAWQFTLGVQVTLRTWPAVANTQVGAL